jgi:hypothetical protein
MKVENRLLLAILWRDTTHSVQNLVVLVQRGTGSSDMDAGLWHFLGSQMVELKARPFFLLALRAGQPRAVGF